MRRILIFFILALAHASLCAASQTGAVKIPSDPFRVFTDNGKAGLKNSQGIVIIPPIYEKLGWSDGSASVLQNVIGFQRNGLWGLIDLSNRELTLNDFVEIRPGDATLLIARKKIPGTVRIRTGCINYTGKVVIPFEYDAIKIHNMRAIVYQRNGIESQYGLIDLQNKVLIPLKYRDIQPLGSLRYSVEDHTRKIAIFKEDGSAITAFNIDSISAFQNDYALFYKNRMMGLIDREGQIKIEASYKEIRRNEDNSFRLKSYDKWSFLSSENKILKQIECDSVEFINNNRLKVIKNNTAEIIDGELKSITPPIFNSISVFEDNKATFRSSDHAGVIDIDGKIIFQGKYDILIKDGNQYRASTRTSNELRWTVLNENGQPLGYKMYDHIDKFNGDFYPVKNRGYWGALKNDGKEMIACVHDSIIDTRFGFVVVKFKGQYGIVNSNDDWILTPQPSRIKLLTPERYFLQSDKTTFLKSMKHETIYFTDNRIEFNEDALREHVTSGAIWKINLNGQIENRDVVPAEIELVSEVMTEGLRPVKKDSRFGFIDDRGRLRIANRYEAVKNFSEGLAAVKIRGKWGFINHQDNIAIQPNYEGVTSFQNSISIVTSKNLYGFINTGGKIILPIRYDEIVATINDRYLVKQNNQWGLVDEKGQIIIHPKYKEIRIVDNGQIIVNRDGKSGVLSKEGWNTIPEVYDRLYFNEGLQCFVGVRQSEWITVKL